MIAFTKLLGNNTEAEDLKTEKVHLRDLAGGERVLQLWDIAKVNPGPSFDPSEFRQRMLQFLDAAMRALESGEPPVQPKTKGPLLPAWAERRPDSSHPNFVKWRLHRERNISIEDIETLRPDHVENILNHGWTMETVHDARQREKKVSGIRLLARKARWPNSPEKWNI